ncbi:MAG: DUF4258 domain-containing protein [Planctomycetota bacterium]
MHVLARIRQAVQEQKYRVSGHANEEISEDGLESHDVESIIMSGTIVKRFTHDVRGTRYEIAGHTVVGRHARIVCRFLISGVLLIITAYLSEE